MDGTLKERSRGKINQTSVNEDVLQIESCLKGKVSSANTLGVQLSKCSGPCVINAWELCENTSSLTCNFYFVWRQEYNFTCQHINLNRTCKYYKN